MALWNCIPWLANRVNALRLPFTRAIRTWTASVPVSDRKVHGCRTLSWNCKTKKFDIVKWDEDPAVYIANALSPAQVVSVTIDEGAKSSVVVVPDYQLSLAIGKAGQNARLAAKLTNWKIDIKSESQAEDGDVATGDDDILAEFDAVDNEATSMPVEDEV